MKNCKKYLSLLLVALLVLTTGVAATVLAVASDDNEAKIGDTEYATLAAAIDAAQDGDTITLLRNVEVNFTKDIQKVITIDGTASQYSMTLKSSYPFHFYKSFTLKNLKIVANAYCFRMYNTAGSESVGTLENVECTMNGSGMLFNIQGSAGNTPQTLNIIDSTITKATASADPMIATYSHSNWAKPGVEEITINIENSTLTQNGGTVGKEPQNADMFYFCCAKSVTLNLKGTTKLNYNAVGTLNSVKALAYYEIPTTVNLESTVELSLLGGGNATWQNHFFYKNNATHGSLTINDSGAAWNVSKAVAERGFYMPNGSYTVNGTGKALATGYASHGSEALTFRKASATYTAADLVTDADWGYSGYSFKVGETRYAEWGDSMVGKVLLTANATVLNKTLKGDVVVDGQGKYNLFSGDYAFWTGKYNLTLQNLTADFGKGIGSNANDGCKIVIDNCTVKVRNGLFMQLAKQAEVLFKDSTITSSAADAMFLINGCSASISLENATLAYTTGASNYADNTAIFNVANANANATIVLDETSKIVYSPSTANGTVYMMSVHTGNATANLTLKAGAVVEFSSCNSKTTTLAFINANSEGSVGIVDEGATWKVGAAVATKGFTFIHKSTTDSIVNTDIVAMMAGGKLYNPTASIKGLTAATEFTTLNMGVSNDKGAAIRLSQPTGIRFVTSVDKDFYTTLGANAVYGVKVTLKDSLNGGSVADVAAENAIVNASNNEGFVWSKDGEQFRTVLMDIDADNYATKLAWTAYVTITYADGTSATYYADWNETDHCRSLADVANAALADESATWTPDQLAILNTIAGVN